MSANALELNEFSALEIFKYFTLALEFEKPDSNWTQLILKTLSDCLYLSSFQNYSYANGVCLSDVIRGGYRAFVADSLKVESDYPDSQVRAFS